MAHTVKIQEIGQVTHNVKSFKVDKPEGYHFKPGQATTLALNQKGWMEEKRPFTFTGLDTEPQLEFMIKAYPEHDGVTKRLHELSEGDEILIDDPWGTIRYKGPGYFIAAGAGLTPFIAIFRQLKEDNNLANNAVIYTNKTGADIILKDELEVWFACNCHFTVTAEDSVIFDTNRIDKDYLKERVTDFSKNFYVCGPDSFVADMKAYLGELGAQADSVVFEE